MDERDLSERRVGSVLRGKWTLERLLGIGGMAAVYVARHKIGRVDAIKILHPEYARMEQLRARFEQEAHVLNRFKHPGAVEVRDLETTEDGAPFIVMELLEGQSLTARIRQSKPTVDDMLRMADEVLDVLAAAHAQGIIHRDIKPDNLFVLPSGAIKVLDFGIAKLRAPDKGQPLKTKTGTTLGTVAYMPPEQLRGQDIDARVDIYGVGATMYRMLAGQPPHRADSEVELLMQVLNEPAPRLASTTEVRADVAHVVDRALAFDRDARYPDAKSMQAEVRAARNAKDAPIAPPPSSEAATVTPARLNAPESNLLREAVPSTPVSVPARGIPTVAIVGCGVLLLAAVVGAGGLALALLSRGDASAPSASMHVSEPAPHAVGPRQCAGDDSCSFMVRDGEVHCDGRSACSVTLTGSLALECSGESRCSVTCPAGNCSVLCKGPLPCTVCSRTCAAHTTCALSACR